MSTSDAQDECLSDVKSDMTTKSEDPDSGDEIPDPSPDAPVYEVRCGLLTGKLHLQRFTCPGIHKRCIEYEGRLISPRQFTIKAEKDKQKDWKGSIRFGRQNLRTLMEIKQIDFYEHETNCSLKCQSRNYIKNRKSDAMESLSLLDSMMSLSDGNQPSSSNGFNLDVRDEHSALNVNRKMSSALEDYVSQTVQTVADARKLMTEEAHEENFNVNMHQQQSRANSDAFRGSEPVNTAMNTLDALAAYATASAGSMPPSIALTQQPPPPELGAEAFSLILQSLMEQQKLFVHNGQNNFLGGLAALNALNKPPLNLMAPQNELSHANGGIQPLTNGHEENAFSVNNIRKVMDTNPLTFWSRMRDLGILDDLLGTLSVTVEQVKSLYIHGSNGTEEFAAQRLSALANVLDLGDIFAQRIHNRYIETTQESNLITKELIELQRKAEEQKKRLESAKRKSQVFDQIIKPVNESVDFKKVKLSI
jgi:hypothetical protein